MTTRAGRSGSSVLLVGVSEQGQFLIGLAKSFTSTQNYRRSYEQFLGNYLWTEGILHAVSATFSFNENTRFDKMLVDRGFVPNEDGFAIEEPVIMRLCDVVDYTIQQWMRKAYIDSESVNVAGNETITSNANGTAQLILPKSSVNE